MQSCLAQTYISVVISYMSVICKVKRAYWFLNRYIYCAISTNMFAYTNCYALRFTKNLAGVNFVTTEKYFGNHNNAVSSKWKCKYRSKILRQIIIDELCLHYMSTQPEENSKERNKTSLFLMKTKEWEKRKRGMRVSGEDRRKESSDTMCLPIRK